MKYWCGNCNQVANIPSLIVTQQRLAGIDIQCPKCRNIPEFLPWKSESGRTDNQKRSRLQEKRAAKRAGGRVQPASGAGRSKGDVRVPGSLRMECKLTRASSYSLKLELLEKLEREATSGEQPVFEIEFQGGYPHKRYVVLPGWLYDHYTSLEEKA